MYLFTIYTLSLEKGSDIPGLSRSSLDSADISGVRYTNVNGIVTVKQNIFKFYYIANHIYMNVFETRK